MPNRADAVLSFVDLTATVFLGIEGGMAAIRGELDLFGILVLAFATALGGGIIRDLLIGAIPPASIRDPRYAIAAFSGGAMAFFLFRFVGQVPELTMTTLDAAGLGLFAVVGAAKALDHGISPLLAVLMGTITGVGGGTTRDLFLARVPAILRVDVYAVAALAGAAVLVIGVKRGASRTRMMAAGAAACLLLRMTAVSLHWNLPKVPMP
ncbi:MAG TPA: TRIC cation channel family protein [Bryobacteraceae bacterium]|nr:TRIC cation channel family protein [Bryobacteraceae bacterium]